MVEFKTYVEECGGLEAAVHHELKELRISPRREFFRISVREAAKVIARLALARSSTGKLTVFFREGGVLQSVSLPPVNARQPPDLFQSISRATSWPTKHAFRRSGNVEATPPRSKPRPASPNQLTLVEDARGEASINLKWVPLVGSKNAM